MFYNKQGRYEEGLNPLVSEVVSYLNKSLLFKNSTPHTNPIQDPQSTPSTPINIILTIIFIASLNKQSSLNKQPLFDLFICSVRFTHSHTYHRCFNGRMATRHRGSFTRILLFLSYCLFSSLQTSSYLILFQLSLFLLYLLFSLFSPFLISYSITLSSLFALA